eukprot:5813812-Pyramimonas_sp.AAC.1
MPPPFTLCLAARDLPPGWGPRRCRLRWSPLDLSVLSPGRRSLRRGLTPERPPSTSWASRLEQATTPWVSSHPPALS